MTMTEDKPVSVGRRRSRRARGDTIGGSRAFSWLLVITGAAGLLASWVITIDKFKLLEDPGFTPGCSLNPVVSCGNIMKSEQASAFGFPNPMLGLVAYSMVIAIGVGLLAGARYRRWYWLGGAVVVLGIAYLGLGLIQGFVRSAIWNFWQTSDAGQFIKNLIYFVFIFSFAMLRLWMTLLILTFGLKQSYIHDE